MAGHARRVRTDTGAFYHVLNTLDKAVEVLFLDDNALDIDTARNLGMYAVRVRGAAGARRALHSAGIIHELDNGGGHY